MTGYAQIILDAFAEGYPKSAHFRGGRRLRLGNWEKRVPEILHDVDAKEDFLSAAESLERKKIVELKWVRFRFGSELDAIVLEHSTLLYEALGIDSPEVVRDRMLEELRIDDRRCKHSKSRALWQGIREYAISELEAGHLLPVASLDNLQSLAELLSAPDANAYQLPIRALSIRLYHDSKRLEKLLPEFDSVALKAVGRTVSEILGLSRSYPEVSFAIHGRMLTAGAGNSQLDCDGHVVTLPMQTVEEIASIKPVLLTELPDPPEQFIAITVENKESFYALATLLLSGRAEAHTMANVCGVVYTAGHPNPAVIAFLKLLLSAGYKINHFGDMDPDGLLIPFELSDLTNSDPIPLCVNLELHRRFAQYGYEISPGAAARLSKALPGLPESYLPLAQEIIATGIGVEQEVIDPLEMFR